MIRKLLAVALCALALPSFALAQSGGNPNNAVGVWGQDSVSGLPCIVAPAGGSATCVLPTTSGGGGGGGAVTIVDGGSVTLGAKADSACASDTATCTAQALAKRQAQTLSTIATNTTGAATAANQATGNTNTAAIATSTATTATNTTTCKDTANVYCAPKAGTADRVVTKTNLTLNTSTTICPTASTPVTTEIYFTTAGVGISLAGGTLTQATVGTTATTTPDLAFNTAGTLYTMPVAPTNAITAYGAAGIVVCIQTLRQ